MRALCVTRHRYLSEHLVRVFDEMGLDCTPCVGLDAAVRDADEMAPDVVIAEYELIATGSLAAWEQDPTLARTPVVAVSMRRHAGDAHLMDVSAVAGFLYLPTLTRDDASRVFGAVRRGSRVWDTMPSLRSSLDVRRHAASFGDA